MPVSQKLHPICGFDNLYNYINTLNEQIVKTVSEIVDSSYGPHRYTLI